MGENFCTNYKHDTIMNRLFGKNKPPAPTLSEHCDTMDSRISTVDKKISLLDTELLKYKTQMSKMRPGPAKNQVQQKALRVLKQKKMYENQRESMANTSFNMDQTNFAIQNMKDGMKAMKKENKKLNIGKIENMQNELEDMMYDSQEIMDVMGRSYGADVDDDELEAELDALGDDILGDADDSYLDVVETPNLPSVPSGFKSDPIAEVDEFGLPMIPANN